ncbi:MULTISPECIES: aldehyde dehydrogenase (NADP(+)) [Prauserella salsuginis group]|uniref:Aldehyde dehydrogenase (NADP(+)) n=1 Tax=Prauserella salsuginis TaxID=387889 RepID=A0ABW6G0V9_9PSEU|nr:MULTISPECIES: aldehyde dehydrogenase (NADP(+)) [Prauserella salsuginis group]MCR3721999.1 NADP-dependent aldehyde dehydrogenase [Prauserella flava]MCR3736005.1 NADP-dependent aldehyde dehydrogenase [Prauserella salsuginis]
MTSIHSVDPRTGSAVEEVTHETTREELDQIVRAAVRAQYALEDAGRAGRAAMLREMAGALEADRAGIVTIADRETALGPDRLNAELTRTCYQLRLFAETVEEGGYLEAVLDSAGDTSMGPRPDLRRMLVPLGVVGVFGASNFPLAFSVPGGDTASALAAGCSVVVKAHGSHPATSARCAAALRAGASAAGLPDEVVAVVYGQPAGALLVRHESVRAVGFTGSVGGGRALLDLIHARPDPIPFYGELASLNPVIVTPSALRERAEEIGTGFADSVTGSAGQLCTKPGLALVPEGSDGDRFVAAATSRIAAGSNDRILLNGRIWQSYTDTTAAWRALPDTRVLHDGAAAAPAVSPFVLETTARDLNPMLTEECFGPCAVIARFVDEAELDAVLETLPASLTATVHGDDTGQLRRLGERLGRKAGRLLFGGFPTGVAVSDAQNHGGPWPATNSLHTSVGTTAIRRFLRPVTWQNAPQDVLPAELRDGPSVVPRRIDGFVALPDKE